MRSQVKGGFCRGESSLFSYNVIKCSVKAAYGNLSERLKSKPKFGDVSCSRPQANTNQSPLRRPT